MHVHNRGIFLGKGDGIPQRDPSPVIFKTDSEDMAKYTLRLDAREAREWFEGTGEGKVGGEIRCCGFSSLDTCFGGWGCLCGW